MPESMECAAALPRGLVATDSLDAKAEGLKKVAVKCLWCPIIKDVCGHLGPETLGITVP